MVNVIKKESFIYLFITVAAVVIFIDQLTKYLIFLNMPEWEAGFVSIHLIKNTGAGFGILQDHALALALVSLIVALSILVHYKKIPQQRTPQFFFALFFSGVVGNFIDRIARGYVIDFLDLSFWPAFNVADASITVAMLGIIIYFWKGDKIAHNQNKNHLTQVCAAKPTSTAASRESN